MNLIAQSPSPFQVESPLRPEITDISSLIEILLSFLLPIGLAIFFFMLVAAGFTFMTAEGNQDKIESAQKTITAALIGLILLTLSFFIVRIIATIFGLGGGII